jgi:hypothetical protein
MNSRRMNRLEELGRVDAERARTRKGKRNLRDEKSRIIRELKADGGKVKKRKKAGPKAGRPAASSEQRRMGRGVQGSRKKEDSSVTLGKFLKSKVDALNESVKAGGMKKERVTQGSRMRSPERFIKDVEAGKYSKPNKDAAYYKSIGLTGKRGDRAVKDFFKPEKLKSTNMATGGRALKPVKPSQKGLKKLPTKVRNKMGYMKKGGRVGMGKAMRGGGCVR